MRSYTVQREVTICKTKGCNTRITQPGWKRNISWCRLCQNERNSSGCLKKHAVKKWPTKKIKLLLPDIEGGD